ncbi:MAG: hypothetical protein V4724_16840 [Pseudomonadota bacterium]
MRSKTKFYGSLTATMLALLAGAGAHADDAAPPGAAAQVAPPVLPPVPAPVLTSISVLMSAPVLISVSTPVADDQAPGGFGMPLPADALGRLRGGTDTVWNDMKLSGTVADNAATHVVTGANLVTDGAFNNASGLSMVIQNSGANVLIQNATIINVQFK